MKSKSHLFLLLVIFSFVKSAFGQVPPPPCCPLTEPFNFVRPLDEVNLIGTSNIYPFISETGLSIYFSQGIDTLKSHMLQTKLFVTTRSSKDSIFRGKTPVSDLFPDSISSCWLTNDELDIYYTVNKSYNNNNSTLWHSKRAAITTPFHLPYQIKLNGMTYSNKENYLAAPSLNTSKNELYLYNIIYTNPPSSYILRFFRQEDSSFTLKDTLAKDILKTVYPGQLSKDGYKFLTSYLKNDSVLIGFFVRDLLSQPFQSSTFKTIKGLINKTCNYNYQPSLSGDFNTIIFTRKLSPAWNGNVMYFASDTATNISVFEIKKQDLQPVKVFPNPANEYITFKTDKRFNKMNLTIYNSIGEAVKRFSGITCNGFRIDLKGLSKGIYYYIFIDLNNNKSSGKFAIE